MPQIRTHTPAPLEELCLLAVVRCLETDLILCEVAKELQATSLLLRRRDLTMAHITQELKEYMAYLPGTLSEMVRQKITNKVITKYTRMTHNHSDNTPWVLPHHTMTVRLLEIVLDNDIHTFDISEFQPSLRTPQFRPQPGDPEIWEVVLGRCVGLRRDLKPVEMCRFCLPHHLSSNLGINLNPFIRSLARQCNKLTEVILRDAVFPVESRTMSTIGKNCPCIKLLDLCGSKVACYDILYLLFPEAIEDQNAMSRVKRQAMLPKPVPNLKCNPLCDTMRELILTNTKVRALGAYFSLKFMPNLTSLGDLVFTASGMEKYYQESKQKFLLKQIFYRASSCEKVKLIGATCPDLEAMHLSSDEARRLNLKYLTKLLKLRSLTLELGQCVHIGLELSHITHLRELQMHVPNIDLGIVAESCPLLQKLVVTLEPKKTVTLSSNQDQLILSHLKELQIERRISLDVAALFLTRAYQLRVVKLERIKKLTDEVLAEWIQLNPLEHLETWLLTYSQLTISSVSLLLSRCPHLSTLGRLSGWDVRSWESRRLQRAWHNYQLNLVHFDHKQQDASQVMDATASSDEDQY